MSDSNWMRGATKGANETTIEHVTKPIQQQLVSGILLGSTTKTHTTMKIDKCICV